MSTLVLSIDQPYASLIMAGVKQFETRPSPPNGDMCPAGVRGLPGNRVNRGDRLLVASTTRVPGPESVGPWAIYGGTRHQPLRALVIGTGDWVDLPLGRILGSVEVTDAYPIDTGEDDEHQRHIFGWDDSLNLCLGDGGISDVSDQLPVGDWTPGRWAWALADPVPTTSRCPWCNGAPPTVVAGHCVSIDGEWWHDPGTCACGMPGRCCQSPCAACNDSGVCEPVPVVGKQGVWRWDGAVRP